MTLIFEAGVPTRKPPLFMPIWFDVERLHPISNLRPQLADYVSEDADEPEFAECPRLALSRDCFTLLLLSTLLQRQLHLCLDQDPMHFAT